MKMAYCGMRQMEDRLVANQVDLMVWCNRLDLLALSNFKGEVHVHRLHWQKVWNLPPPKENSTVSGMTWRHDGKALAIGYSCGRVCIVDIEYKMTDNFYTLKEMIEDKNNSLTCVSWVVRNGPLQNVTDYKIYDDASIFLPKPPLNTTYNNKKDDDEVTDFRVIAKPSQLNILIIGYGQGNVTFSVFGRFPCGTINIGQLVNDENGEYSILDVQLSDNFNVMQVFYMNKASGSLHIAVVDTTVLSAYAEELYAIAVKHSNVMHMLSHIDQTMISITEAWEHILLEMDSKMADYATSVPEGGVSADFLELLMMGVPSDELEVFLLQELTAKGLKKFGSSVELSYSTIQKLVLKQLNIVGQSLTYYLSELRGLARIPDRFEILGLEENAVTEAIKASSAFLNKCLELQQVIDLSMRNYKAFFRWLFVVIVRLLDEQTPSEIVKITQQELTHIAEFLYNFDHIGNENTEDNNTLKKPVRFNLERLAQYLQDQDLTILVDEEDNPWQKFLKDNPCLLKDNDTIVSMTEFRQYSLVQQQNHLKNAVHKVFDLSVKNISSHFSVLKKLTCFDNEISGNIANSFRLSQMYDSDSERFIMAFITLPPEKGLYFMSINVKNVNTLHAARYHFTSNNIEDSKLDAPGENMLILDVQFYSNEFLSVLLQHPHNDTSVFVQFPVKMALEHCNEFKIDKLKTVNLMANIPKLDASQLLYQGVFKVLHKMSGHRIAVSGGRKVAVVLSKSGRKVRIFEMDVDGEEEDDTLDTTPISHNNTQRSDTSQESQDF